MTDQYYKEVIKPGTENKYQYYFEKAAESIDLDFIGDVFRDGYADSQEERFKQEVEKLDSFAEKAEKEDGLSRTVLTIMAIQWGMADPIMKEIENRKSHWVEFVTNPKKENIFPSAVAVYNHLS